MTESVLSFEADNCDDSNRAEPCREYEAVIQAPVPDQEARVKATDDDEAGHACWDNDPSQDIWDGRFASKLKVPC